MRKILKILFSILFLGICLSCFCQDSEEYKVLNDILPQIEKVNCRLRYRMYSSLKSDSVNKLIIESKKPFFIYNEDINVFKKVTQERGKYLLEFNDSLVQFPIEFFSNNRKKNIRKEVSRNYPMKNFITQNLPHVKINEGLLKNPEYVELTFFSKTDTSLINEKIKRMLYLGKISFSRIYFDTRKEYAITIYGYFANGLNGNIDILLLKKENRNWVIRKAVNCISF